MFDILYIHFFEVFHMVLILKFLPILLLIFVTVLLARRFTTPKEKIVDSDVGLIPF